MRHHRALAPVLATVLLLAGCGGGDAGEGATGTTTSAPTSSAPAPVSADPAKEAQAKAAVLQDADFPPGWQQQEPEEGLDLETTWRDLTACVGVEGAGETLAIATSPTFLRGLATQARSTVEYMPEPQAQSVAAALDGPKFQECATKAFAEDAGRNAPEGGKPGPVEVKPLEFAELGERTFAWRATFNLALGDMQVPIVQDLVAVFDEGAVSRFMFLNPGSPFPEDLGRSLVETVVGRV